MHAKDAGALHLNRSNMFSNYL